MIEDYNVYELSRTERVKFLCGLTFFCGFIGYVFYAGFLPAVITPFIYKKAETVYCHYLAEKRKDTLLIQFRDLLYSLSSSFATGRHMKEAMEEAEVNLCEIYGVDSLLYSELLQMIKRMEETGETDIQVWRDFAKRTGLEDILDFTAVYHACRETGGNLISAVNKAAAVIGEKISVEREIKTQIAQKKLEGRIITTLPVIVILFLQMMSPEYLEIMYTSFAGRLMMTFSLGAAAAAYVVIERITQIEV